MFDYYIKEVGGRTSKRLAVSLRKIYKTLPNYKSLQKIVTIYQIRIFKILTFELVIFLIDEISTVNRTNQQIK